MIKCKLSIRGFSVCEKDICCFCCSDLEVCRIRCSRDTPKGCNNKLEAKEEPNKNYEYVNNPNHYGGSDNVYEAIKVIEAWELNFNI